jgi:nucleotide-binding universal stress UspA family protein
VTSDSQPVLIAYDGSPAAEHAIRDSGRLLAGRRALVVVVWKAGLGFELLSLPTAGAGLPPATVDVRTALEFDRELQERALLLAREGAGVAREAGFDAEGLAVVEDQDFAVAEAIAREASKRDAAAVVVGAHGHGALSSVILGPISRDVIRHAPCPVLVVRENVRKPADRA